MPPGVKVNVVSEVGRVASLSQAELGAQLRKAARIAGVRGGVWSVCLLNDEAMIELHARTMGLKTTTDVLTFDGLGPNAGGGGEVILLDTAICVDEARRRAEELGHPLGHEVLLYGVHSLLHVMGFDDKTPAKFKAMHRREDEILAALGMGPVFSKAAVKRKGRSRR